MENEIIQTLSGDEVVGFIAGRHNVDPELLVKMFIEDEAKESIMLLDNEVAILRGLLNQYKQLKKDTII